LVIFTVEAEHSAAALRAAPLRHDKQTSTTKMLLGVRIVLKRSGEVCHRKSIGKKAADSSVRPTLPVLQNGLLFPYFLVVVNISSPKASGT